MQLKVAQKQKKILTKRVKYCMLVIELLASNNILWFGGEYMVYPKLRGAIREKFGTQGAFAKALGVNQATLVRKLAGKAEFKIDEVQTAVELLDIPHDRIGEYFFKD